MLAFRFDPKSKDSGQDQLERLVEIARTYPEDERIDEIFVLGMTTDVLDFEGYLAALVPTGSPEGPLDYHCLKASKKNLRIFLLDLYVRLGRIRTGPPKDILSYLFEGGVESKTEKGPDERLLRLGGEVEVKEAVKNAVKDAIGNVPARCPICGGDRFAIYEDLYQLVATKDDYFGKLGGPRVPVAILECRKCFHLSLHSSNGLGVTTTPW